MSLKEKIQQDLKESLKAKEELRSSVLRLLLASMLNKEKGNRYRSGKEEDAKLTEDEILEVVASEVKKRREAAAEYEKGGRPELADKEKKELEILQKYLPEQMSEEEIRKLVLEAAKKAGASGPKDMGKVMAELMPKVKGRADGALVSKIVKEELSSLE